MLVTATTLAEKPDSPPKKAPTTGKAKASENRKRIGHVRLSGAVVNAPAGLSLFSFSESSTTLRDWMHRLAAIRKNERISAVALEVGSVSLTWAHAQELSEAIARLNEVKPVHAHLTSTGTAAYLVASAAKTVSIEPAGMISIAGLAAELTFFRGMLDWLGIEPQFIQIGRYKGASEPFSRTEPSKELLGEYNKILDDLYDQLVAQIARQRKQKPAAVREAIDQGPFTAAAADRLKLVDKLESRFDWQARLTASLGDKTAPAVWIADFGKKKAKALDLSNPFALMSLLLRGSGKKKVTDPTIAIVHADGAIMSGKSRQGFFGLNIVGSKTLVECFDEIAEDDRIKAVVFRINSPGGSALASELILQAVRRCAKKKPVITSIAQVGASGGYYIALGGSKILGDACGLTGSIGVISGKLPLSGPMGKIGISTHAITRGKNAGLMLSRPWTDREKDVMRKMAREIYSLFTKRVKESRGKRIPDIEKVAQGRIFTARQAKAAGLIDEIGGLREAVMLAKDQAKLTDCHFITLPTPPSLMDMLGGGMGIRAMLTDRAREYLSRLTKDSAGVSYVLTLTELLQQERVLTAMPHHVTIRK